MSRNIKFQFKSAIENSFKTGMDKHSTKIADKQGTDKVYSFADRRGLIDLSSNFSNFMAETHPEIRMLTNITADHVQEFMNAKAKNCSQETLKQYHSKFAKLEKIANKSYGLKLHYTREIYTPVSEHNQGKVRNLAMREDDYKALIKVASTSKSHAVKAIELARTFGLRVSETTKLQSRDIDLQRMKIHVIDSKGGRSRHIPIQEKNVELCERLKADCTSEKERIVPIKSDSVNRFVSRQFEKLGIEDYKDADTGIHSIRKMFAQEYYDRCREDGMEIKEAMNSTSVILGHGEDRMSLMKEYISCIK